MTDGKIVAQFANAMRERGIIPPNQVLADGKLHRCDAAGHNGKGDAAYLLHVDGIAAGGFQNWRDCFGWQDWCTESVCEFTTEQYEAHKHRMAEARVQRDADEQQRQTDAAERAAGIWRSAVSEFNGHPYLAAKHIGVHGARLYHERLVIPVWDHIDGAIISAQFIDRAGAKRFLSGGRIKAGCHVIGKITHTTTINIILIAEGFATGATLHEATDYPVVIAFNAGNLPPVAALVRQRFPAAKIVIAADDDHNTDGNPGITKAREAAAQVAGVVAVPDFGPDRPGHYTDFNDLGHFAGQDRVRAIIEVALADEPGPADEKAARHAPKFSEEALALEFAERYSGTLRFTPIWSKWFWWCGTYWRADDTLNAFHHSRDLCRDASRRVTHPKHASFARSIASAKTVAAVASLGRADRRIVTEHSAWDADLWTLSGAKTVDLRTGRTRDPHPDDLCTKITAVAPDLKGCPIWLAFLDRVTGGDRDLQRYLQRIAGYSLTGSTREHAVFFFHGTGANGKSVLLNTLRAIWHDYAITAPMEIFVETHVTHHHHETELAYLRGARLVIAQETERGRRWAESKIKNLTGGDPIAARYMRQDFFEFVPQLKLLIAGNHKPAIRSVDEAIRRRFHLIPFNVTIPPSERDPQLAEKLRAEWGAILQWAIEGCLEWQKIGLAPPKLVTDATERYLADEDALGRWIEERCAVDATYSALANELYVDWKSWAESTGERPGTRRGLYKELDRRGFDRAKSEDGVMFFGIALRP